MPRRDEYRRMAETCLAMAEEVRDPGERKKLLELAGGYMALTRHVAKRHDHGTAHRAAEHDPEHHPDDA